MIPTMIAPEHLDVLRGFMDELLLPHLRGSRTAASSGLVRKLAVKAKGRWWVAKLRKGYRLSGEMDMPNGLEEELDDLMSGLGDKVGHHYRIELKVRTRSSVFPQRSISPACLPSCHQPYPIRLS